MEVLDKIKIKGKRKDIIFEFIKRGVWLGISFLLSSATVIGGNCPFAVSLITVSSKKNLLFSMIGAGAGYIIFCNGENAGRYFSAVLIASLGTLALNIFKARKKAYLPMVISSLSILVTGIVMNIRSGDDLNAYALTLGESVLALGASYFFFKAVNCNLKRLKYKTLPIVDLTCLIVSTSILLSSLSFIKIFSISPARLIACLIILITATYAEQKWALIISLCLGFSLGIGNEESLFLLGAYGFSALIATLFSSLSVLGVFVSYSLSLIFFSTMVNAGTLSLCVVAEGAIAGLILVLLPEALTEKTREFFDSGADIAPDGSLRQSLIVRLRFASSALAQVSESVRDVSEKINELGGNQPLENEIRMVAADQFFSISDMLEDLAFEFNDAEIFDFKCAGKIRRMLGEYEIYPENISVIIDKYDRMRVEILTSIKTQGIDSPRIKSEISRICQRDFEKSRINYSGSNIMMSIIERPNYKVNIGFAQYCAEGKLCGDTIKTINDSRGHMVLIISDGMGKGSRAALDGAMGAGLLSKLLGAGFGFDSSLKVVNSALLVKSNEESLATLDCACIDLFNGKCEFYKAGAPKSYIVKDSSLTKCELSSMAAGILRGIEFAKRTTILNTGDEIIMMSDGITDIKEEYLEAFLKLEDSQDPNEKANAILKFALENTHQDHRDDMSVIVARLERARDY